MDGLFKEGDIKMRKMLEPKGIEWTRNKNDGSVEMNYARDKSYMKNWNSVKQSGSILINEIGKNKKH